MAQTTTDSYCTIYLVRHGQTEWNVKRLIQGQKDSSLTAIGEEQARRLGRVFRPIQFTAVFSSDLLRAHKTAKLITLERDLLIQTKKLLRERSFGSYEGETIEKMREDFREMDKIYGNLPEAEKKKFKYAENIESDEEIVSRLILLLREISVAYRGKKVLVVSHGGIIKAFLIHLGFATYKDTITIHNAAHAVIDSDGIDFIIKDTNGIEKTRSKR